MGDAVTVLLGGRLGGEAAAKKRFNEMHVQATASEHILRKYSTRDVEGRAHLGRRYFYSQNVCPRSPSL